jgi:hypothetical protein
MSNNTNQPTNTGSNVNNDTRTRANRRIDAKTISGIARFCAKQLTESEACRLLNVRPQSWFSWKSRHNRAEKFAALLEEFRAGRIETLIARIEKSADGVGLKQPDWRAASALLSHVDPRRFSDSGMRASIEISVPTTPPGQMSDETMTKLLAMLRAGNAKPVIDVPASEPKQIADAGTKPPKE